MPLVMRCRGGPIIVSLLSALLGCGKNSAEESPVRDEAPVVAQGAAPDPSPSSRPSQTPPSGKIAEIGAAAPQFALRNLAGERVALSDHAGKIVVLEWFNPGCPFVRMSHTVGSLVDAPARHGKEGVVWLAVNSGAPGKQGHGIEANRRAKKDFGMAYPVLIDESGQVGRQYGAKRTPHMFVIDPRGKLVYAGAIDNSPDGEGKSPQGGALVHYVDAAIEAVKAGQPVAVPRTKAYGCSVKYDS